MEKNDENCISNAEKVKNYSKRLQPGHWTFLGSGSEKRWCCSSHDGQWDRTANKMVQQFKETGHPIFTVTSALSRGTLKQRKGKCTIHFNGDFRNTELKVQTLESVNQVSIYAAVTNWSCKVAFKKAEKHIMLKSSPNQASTGKPDDAERRKIQSIGKEGSHDPQLVNSSEFDQMEKMDGEKSHLHAENILVLKSAPNQTVGSYSSRHNYRTDPRRRRAAPPTREGRNTASHKKSKEEEAAPLKGGRDRR